MADDPTMVRHFNLIRLLSTRRLGVTIREPGPGAGRRRAGRSGTTWIFLKRMGVPVEERTGDRPRETWKLGESWTRAAAGLYLRGGRGDCTWAGN